MDTNKLGLVDNEYDDGVVCFGPVTESQLDRYRRLPRRTVLPSDFELSQSYFEQDEDKKNDQSTVLDEPNENTTTCIDNSINITLSTNNIDGEKEEIRNIELKQSISEDSNPKFSSPCFSKCISNENLIATEVINRYIRMGSISSNDSSLSEDQIKSTFEDETVSFTDAQETESIQENCVFDETSTCEHLSVSSVIDQSVSSNQQNVLDDSNNVCTLIHCSQKDDTDLSICSDSEFGDVTEDSIVADEYSVTPGKQRLFDLRVTKQSLRSKALVASAPFMDRIEETATPVLPKALNSPLILNKISHKHSEIKESLKVSSTTEICHDTSTEHFNQTSDENVLEASKFVDETVGELLTSNDLKNIVYVNTSVNTMFDETMDTNKLSTDSRSMNINKSLIETDQIKNTVNDTMQLFDTEQSINIMTNITIPTDVNDQNDGEYLIAGQLDTESANTSIEDKIIEETIYANKLSTNSKSIDLNQSLNETDDHIQTAINDSEQNFDKEKLMFNLSNKAIPTPDINNQNYKEFSVAMEVDIKSTNTSYVDKGFDETMCTDKYSTNSISMDLNQSINETEHNFDDEKSICIISKEAIPTSDTRYHNDVEYSVPMEVDIKSTNTSYLDNEFDETACTSKQSTNNRTMNLNQSLNETNIEYILNDTKQKLNDEEFSVGMEVNIKSTTCVDKEINVRSNNFPITNLITDLDKSSNSPEQSDDKKLTYIMSNIAIPTLNLTDHIDEKENSITTEVNIKSIDTTEEDKIFDEIVNTNKLSINNQSMDLKKSLDETNIENSLNDIEQKFGEEKSMDNISNIAIPTSDVNDYNDERFSVAMEVDIKSTDTSYMDNELDDTVHANKPIINNQSMEFNKSLDVTNHIENTVNDTEQKCYEDKSYTMSNTAIPTYSVNDHNDKENSIAAKVDIKSINTSIVDNIFDESMLINANELLVDSQAINCNKSLNETGSTSNNTEHGFMNNIQNTSVSTIHVDDKLIICKQDQSNLKNTINSDNSFVGVNEVNITCNTSLEDPSCMMRQYLDFEQAVTELCNDISSVSCPNGNPNKPKESYDDEALEHLIEQTLSSDSYNLTKVDENFSNYDGSKLSVIIENESLDTSSNDIEQHEDIVDPNNDVPITLESESIVREVNGIESLNKSTAVNTEATSSVSEVGLAYETDVKIQIKANSNINETKHNGSLMSSDELSKMELDTFNETNKNMNITTKQIFISKEINEIHSTNNSLDENNLNSTANQINITDIPNTISFKIIPETEIAQNNLTDQNKLLDNSLEEFANQKQMLNFGDIKKEKQVEYKTPKTQKILDFSIVQQTPTFDNQIKKQKVLNFSIVDPTPILKSTQQIYPNDDVINNESLINFSSVDQVWNSEVVTKDNINFKDFQNSPNDSSFKTSSNNLSSVSSPDFELLADESIKTNTSNFSNSSFDQTITDSNLNLSPYSCANNKPLDSKTELNNLEPLILINKQIVADESSSSLNQTKTVYDEHHVVKASTTAEISDLKLLSNSTSNKNIDFVEFKEDLNQQLCFNSNERAIVDFSIIDQGILENIELKNKTDIIPVESDRNVSNLIEMTLVSKSDEQSIVLSKNPIIPITSDKISENSIHSNSDEMNSTALHLEQSTFLHNNTELLTDIQMNDESLLMESPEKSSIVDSFHSIELDNIQEDNKRKIETTQEYDNTEKKMKVETEMLKTPMSMLYKIKNMFRSSEKQPSCINNTKENDFKSGRCYQKLNFNKFEENTNDFSKPIPLKKSEVLVKSKIPCKVTDRPLIKNDEFNSSSLSSLNDSVKQKKTIPKFSGVPVLSDVSNSSNRKCAESRIPSKFQK